jgi:hypothetical protein
MFFHSASPPSIAKYFFIPLHQVMQNIFQSLNQEMQNIFHSASPSNA